MAIKRELSLQERFELLDEVHTALIRGVEITSFNDKVMIDLQKLLTDCREKLAAESLKEKGMIQNENGSWVRPQEVIDNDNDWSGGFNTDAKMKEIVEKHNINIDWNESIESMKSKNDNIKKRLADLDKPTKTKKKVKKAYVLDFVDSCGDEGATYTDIIRYMYELDNPGEKYTTENRGWYSTYMNDGGVWNQDRKGGWINPTKSDSNYLVKSLNTNGELRWFTIDYVTENIKKG